MDTPVTTYGYIDGNVGMEATRIILGTNRYFFDSNNQVLPGMHNARFTPDPDQPATRPSFSVPIKDQDILRNGEIVGYKGPYDIMYQDDGGFRTKNAKGALAWWENGDKGHWRYTYQPCAKRETIKHEGVEYYKDEYEKAVDIALNGIKPVV